MTYKNFLENIQQYYDLYYKGLKKEANKYMDSYILKIKSNIPKSEIQEILYKFCFELCEVKNNKWRTRGNGRLPYSLDHFLWNYLDEECRLDKMPHLRWAYELYRYNPFDENFNSGEIIERAYKHKDCDNKTSDLFFEHNLSILAWGAHHFPDELIIEKEVYENAIKKCYEILEEKNISQHLKDEFLYYEKLYRCFEKYEESDRKADFYKFCAEENIKFSAPRAYYY